MDSGIKILAIGAATQDVFLTGKILTAKRDVRTHSYMEQFPLGEKFDLDQVYFETGGGAMNAAVTFARQGLKSGFVGKIGQDSAGTEIVRVLAKETVERHITYDEKLSTGYSTLLLAPSGERTILRYRGAGSNLKASDFPIHTFAADWFYLTSLGGNVDLLMRILKHAKDKGIKVAYNPGSAELDQIKKLRKALPYLEVLIGNFQELRLVFGGETPQEVIARGFGTCPYIVLSNGPEGTYVTDSDKLYYAGQYQKVKVVDRTGAGDAFGSGFVTALAQGLSLEHAVTLGSANATSVIQKIGAKAGILRTTRLKRMKLKTIKL
jgi:sugar/nucleoside kinase (ribokinase family)